MPDSDRLAWWTSARFGMSLHFGAYSQPARGEWIRSAERLPLAAYQRWVDGFDPAPGCAREWARLAKRAGAGYVVLTTKHHDGFCLFDSKLTTYKAKRDLVREYVDALRAEGLRVGLYYSLVDWQHPDYPGYGDRQHPLRHDAAQRERDAGADWSRYVRYLHGQVEELLTGYGAIDLLVFDFSYWDYHGERWGGSELMRTVRRLQPGIIVNDRLGREAIKQSPPPPWVGDFHHDEQDIPREPIRDAAGRRVPWESWISLNNSWCHAPLDHAWKQPGDIVRALVNCVSKDGNLMVNVGPDPRGDIAPEAVAILERVGDWLARNGESVRGCGDAGLPKPEWGRWTRRGDALYAHLLEPVIGHVSLPGLRGRVKDPFYLATRADGILCDYWNPGVQTFDAPDDIFLNQGNPTAWTFPVPDRMDTVVRLTLTGDAERDALLAQYRAAAERALERRPF